MVRWVWVLMAWALWGGTALAEPRIALIMGNGAYSHVGALHNPANDAQLMADTLSGLGFTVTLLRDGNKAAMAAAVAKFGADLRAGGAETVGLFFYAGHGVQSFQQNYLLPVDAELRNAADLDLVAVDAESVLRQMASARNRANIFILDACRNNPFAAIPEMGESGLAEMKAPTGTFLAYATAPTEVALDGLDGHSPFTKALAAMMVTQGLPLEEMFKQVRVAVLAATGGKQTPWDTSSMTQDFTFAPTASDEEHLWAGVSGSRDPVQIKLFLKAYPKTTHRAEAEVLLAALLPPPTGISPEQVDPDLQAAIAAQTVTFGGKLTLGPADIAGNTIEGLIKGSPMYSPIDGLPVEAWQGKHCTDCHQWTQAALCDQGKFYVKEDPPVALLAQHPLGGAFKLTLRQWASAGCK